MNLRQPSFNKDNNNRSIDCITQCDSRFCRFSSITSFFSRFSNLKFGRIVIYYFFAAPFCACNITFWVIIICLCFGGFRRTYSQLFFWHKNATMLHHYTQRFPHFPFRTRADHFHLRASNTLPASAQCRVIRLLELHVINLRAFNT